eukprot:gnl/Trimastix_PCT/1426.p1 GENE.gnl/Trimastix_PCT/1426~~gnl/Trimastix_PCT/1426.p1  ORF type:complete len:265 (+),score=45.92 gnl/Trimastix_PCT/1426:57-851(+)
MVKPKVKTPRNRVLLLSARGIVSRYRHLMKDLYRIIPHSKKEPKLERKDDLSQINELCVMRQCDSCLFFETRKKQELYIWLSAAPNGPSIKFQIYNVHTMDELRLTGNSIMNSRPILSFDGNFDAAPHYQLMKHLITQTFAPPFPCPRVLGIVDRILSFHIADGKIWFRHFQVVEGTGGEETMLVEIGPRFVMDPVRIFDASFLGGTLWRNPQYTAPGLIRAQIRTNFANKFVQRQEKKKKRALRDMKEQQKPPQPLDVEVVFS